MNSRERVMKSLSHQAADRVPVDLGGYQSGITAVALEKVYQKLGWPGDITIMERVQQLATPSEELLHLFGVDTRYVFLNGVGIEELPERNAYRDEWGILWEKREGCFYYEIAENPLHDMKELTDLNRWEFPRGRKTERVQGLGEQARRFQAEGFPVFTSISGPFEQAWYLRGLEKTMFDLVENRGLFLALYEKTMASQMELYGYLCEAVPELDVIEIWGDLTSQIGPMFSPEFYRKYLKPLDRQYIDFFKSRSNARIAWHCCGAAVHFIPDLIDIGVEILNPVQVSARGMDTAALKKEFGKDLVFWGGVDTQSVLPRGSVAEVHSEVKKRIHDLSSGGGYLLASVHNIQPDVPPENVLALFEAAREYGGSVQ